MYLVKRATAALNSHEKAEVVREKAISGHARGSAARDCRGWWIASSWRTSCCALARTIYVEREGQKGILTGKRGETIKKIGTQARQEVEAMLGAHIFLELNVSVQSNWRQSSSVVRQLDWRRQLEQLAERQDSQEPGSLTRKLRPFVRPNIQAL